MLEEDAKSDGANRADRIRPTPPRLEDLPDILHIAHISALFQISRTQAYEYARRGQLPVQVIKCGRRIFLSKAALVLALQQDETGQSPEGKS